MDGEASTFAASAAGNPKLSSDAQWITGLTNGYEYITKDTYDRVTGWLNAGKITQKQADRYWTRLQNGGFGKAGYTNVLDANGFPVGGEDNTRLYNGFDLTEKQADRYWTRLQNGGFGKAGYTNVLDANGFPVGGEDNTRLYNGFDLTDGNKLEILSEWYGKTVYFRPVQNGQKWTSTGTAIAIPAYTNLLIDDDGHYVESASGTKYKKAITMLNAFVPDTGSVYKNYLGVTAPNGWILDDDGHYVESASGTKYKKAITMLNAFVPDTGSVYKNYLGVTAPNGWILHSADDNIHIHSGTKYKKAITMLNAFVPDTGSVYKNYLGVTAPNGWILHSADDNIHIQLYTVNCESFNRDPARYLVDAEGNYRMDSFAWGVCTDQEPDISGKAYWELKNGAFAPTRSRIFPARLTGS